MQRNSFKLYFINYWRNIDKNILISILLLFILGLFFSFSSTSSLAGERLNKDYYFFFSKHLIFTFFSLGLFFSFSSTSSLAGERLNKDYYFFFSKHLIFTLLALSIMVLLSFIETSLLKKFVVPLFVISFIFLALVPFFGIEVKGAKRWLDFYIFRLQPIELLKPFFILVTVKILTVIKIKRGFSNSTGCKRKK